MDKKEIVYSLIDKHYRANFETLVKKLGRYSQPAVAEDIVQESYLRALTYWEAFPDDGETDKWMNAVINNCARDFHRTEILQGMADPEMGEEQFVNASAIPSIMKQEVLDLIVKKEEKICDILYLALIYQWKPSEIVKAGKADTAAMVRQTVHRFRKELKDVFA